MSTALSLIESAPFWLAADRVALGLLRLVALGLLRLVALGLLRLVALGLLRLVALGLEPLLPLAALAPLELELDRFDAALLLAPGGFGPEPLRLDELLLADFLV